jgi:hypothetical protein
MAILATTVVNAYEFQQLDQKLYTDTDEYEIWTCKCDLQVTGGNDYATANDATVSPATAIQNAKRDGKTVTVISLVGVRGGSFNLLATPTVDTLYGLGLVSDVTANVVTLPLTGEDWSTELTDATVTSTATDKEPSTVQVLFKQKALAE